MKMQRAEEKIRDKQNKSLYSLVWLKEKKE